MTDKSISEKFLLKPGRTLKLINAPENYLEILGPLPAFARIVSLSEPADVVQLFIHSYAELEVMLPGARALLGPGSIFWICYPKRTGKIKTDIDQDILKEYAILRNWKGIGMFSINYDWAAIRFKTQ